MKKKEISAVLESPNKIVIKEFDIPIIKADEMLLRVERVGICGSDPAPYKGEGEFNIYPLILGHEMVGWVDEIGSEASKDYNVRTGDRVTVEPYIPCGKCKFCQTGYYQLCKNKRVYGTNVSCNIPPHLFGAYGEYMYVFPGSRVHKVSRKVPAEAAVMSSVIGNGVRWIVTKGKVSLGDKVVIIGPGAQGLASTIVAKEVGASCIILLGTDSDTKRLELGKEFGATHTINVEQENAIEVIKEITRGDMADVVVENSGSSKARILGLDLLRPLGRYVLSGEGGLKSVPLVIDKIVSNELQLFGGWGQSWNVEQAIGVINSQRYPIEKLVTQVFPLEKADNAMRFFMENPQKCIRVVLSP